MIIIAGTQGNTDRCAELKRRANGLDDINSGWRHVHAAAHVYRPQLSLWQTVSYTAETFVHHARYTLHIYKPLA